MGPPNLLRSAADVTPEWLTAALLRAGALASGARVVSFEHRPIGTGQMADTTRFVLTYDEAGAGPASVVGKFASADDQSRGDLTGSLWSLTRGPALGFGRGPREDALGHGRRLRRR